MGATRELPRVLFLNGMVDEVNTTDLMASIININAEDDIIIGEESRNLNEIASKINIVKMTNGYPIYDKLDDGTNLGINLADEVVARPPITLHIKSNGGYVEHGLALVNMIRTSNTPINAIVHFGHSMGFLIASACDYRIGFPTTRMMIHDMSGGSCGTTEQLIRSTEESKILRNLADQVIIENTKITKDMLDEINEKVEDRYFTGKELLEFGVLDDIIEYNIPDHKAEELRILEELALERTNLINSFYEIMNDNNINEIEEILDNEINDETTIEEILEWLCYLKDDEEDEIE